MAAKGRFDAPRSRVLVDDEKEASALYNKGAYGTPQSGGAVDLDLAEALYLVENNRLSVAGHTAASLLFAAVADDEGFETRYVVYRDLRARGFVVKSSNLSDFNTYPRGAQSRRKARVFSHCCSAAPAN